MSKAAITTHILNLDAGKPATGVKVLLFKAATNKPVAGALTNGDGRITEWDAQFEIEPGIYYLQFFVGDWFIQQGRRSFYPEIQITFTVTDTTEHYHVPLLLNAHGYSTYRGS